jgi:GNAT superfamily N-acetyltransferase
MLCPVKVASLGFRTDLMLRQLEGSEIVDHGDYITVRSPHNPMFWWGNFLLMPASALHDEASGWLSRYARAFPAAQHTALGVDGCGSRPAVPAEYQAAGFKPERTTVMTACAVQAPPRPNRAADYRPLRTEQDWAQAFDLRMACLEEDAPGAREFYQRRVADQRRLAEAGHGSWFGAFLDRRLVAQLGLFTDGEGVARYQSVETHPSARGHGLAGTLVHHAGQYGLDSLGAHTLVIVADPGY